MIKKAYNNFEYLFTKPICYGVTVTIYVFILTDIYYTNLGNHCQLLYMPLLVEKEREVKILKGYRHLNFDDRLRIESMYRRRVPVRIMATALNCTRQTIYNELKRGFREQMHPRTWLPRNVYDAREAQQDYNRKAALKGAPLKIGNDRGLAQKIEYYIVEEGRSPYDALCYVGRPFSVSTLYSYIDKGIFLRLTNQHLPEKSKRKTRRYRPVRCSKRPHAGISIAYRPEHIDHRQELGHWEMDCVIGKAKGKGQALLVLTERVTRAELMFHLKEKTSRQVISILHRLSRKPSFQEVFKTITVDNGPEFLGCWSLDQWHDSDLKVYYCHPFTSIERASNEVANRLVRRRFPKGRSLAHVRSKDTVAAMRWQNTIHRRLLGGLTAEQMFNQIAPVPLETFYTLR